MKVLIILAHAVDKKGKLSLIAKERLEKGLEVFHKLNIDKIQLTGGTGINFNQTKKPFYYYSKKYLVSKGINKEIFFPGVDSQNTVKDAIFSRRNIDNENTVIVVTSDYHMKRVKFIFKKVFKRYKIKFYSSKTKIDKEQLKKLKEHEKLALKRLKKLKHFY